MKTLLIKNQPSRLGITLNKKQLALLCVFIVFITFIIFVIPQIIPKNDSNPQNETTELFPKNLMIVPDDYPTITDAIGNATEDTIIYLKQGTYNITEKALQINKTLTIIGEDQTNTIINSPADTRVGFEFFIPKIVFEVNANNFKIANLTIKNSDYGIYLTGNQAEISNITTVSLYIDGYNNTISHNNTTLAMGSDWGCIYVYGSYNNITENYLNYVLRCKGTFNNITGNSGFTLQVTGDSNYLADNEFLPP
jgi:hypothetical protein